MNVTTGLGRKCMLRQRATKGRQDSTWGFCPTLCSQDLDLTWNRRSSFLQRRSHWRTMHSSPPLLRFEAEDWPVIFGKPAIEKARPGPRERLVSQMGFALLRLAIIEPCHLRVTFLQPRDVAVPSPLALPSVSAHQPASGAQRHRDRRRERVSWNPNSAFALS